ncbi:MAG: DNA-binding response regulator [Citrobacter freundii]|nr:MAG: DNA-binding response regulator [Citrobacter freundii]
MTLFMRCLLLINKSGSFSSHGLIIFVFNNPQSILLAMAAFQILIADDHLSVRLGLRMLVQDTLGSCSVTFASNGKEIFQLMRKQEFHFLITDLNMPGVDMITLVHDLLQLQPGVRIMVMSVNPENVFARRMLAAGAYCYLQKDAPEEDIVNAIKALSQGRKYMTPSQMDNIQQLMTEPGGSASPFSKLSERELAVTLLLLKGHGPLEISNTLSISSSTASSFKSRIYEKLGISNVIELNTLAQVHGLTDAKAAE